MLQVLSESCTRSLTLVCISYFDFSAVANIVNTMDFQFQNMMSFKQHVILCSCIYFSSLCEKANCT
jgi:hypothetical protein